jgi:DNA polymerase-4
VNSRAQLHEVSLGLIRSVLPAAKGIRLVGVTLSNFVSEVVEPPMELSLLPG